MIDPHDNWESWFEFPYPTKDDGSLSEPTYAGLLVLRGKHSGSIPLWWVEEELPYILWHSTEQPMITANMKAIGMKCSHLHADNEIGFDANKQYLNAAKKVRLARNSLIHQFETPNMATGMFLIKHEEWKYGHCMPDPLGRGIDTVDGYRWVATPTLTLLRKLNRSGYYNEIEILDWWGEKDRSPLRGGCSAIINAMKQSLDDKDSMDLLKASANRAFGAINKPSRGGIFRPDWYAAIKAQARCDLWSTCWDIGQETNKWPLRINFDTVIYEGDDNPGFQLDEWGLVGFRRKHTLTEKDLL